MKIMKIQTNGEYNPIQLNETINLSPGGKILSKSLMLNLRGETAKEVWQAYQELKMLSNGVNGESQKKVRNNPGNRVQNKRRDGNICPECGGLVIEKQGISKKTGKPYHFFGCANFVNGCKYSRPAMEIETIDVEQIPF